MLEIGEKAEFSVWLLIHDTTRVITSSTATNYWTADANGAYGILSKGTILSTNDTFSLTLNPSAGAVVNIEQTLPSRLDAIMDLK